MKRISPNKPASGFTLIELMVAISIFVIVAFVVTATFLTVVRANTKAQQLRTIMDNLNFSLENIFIKLREGNDYHCGSGGNLEDPADCSSGESSIAFKDRGGNKIIFTLADDEIKTSKALPADQFESSNLVSITPPDVKINQLVFYVANSSQGQPRATIFVDGSVEAPNLPRTDFQIQTTVSQRD